MKVILASQSPRRANILNDLGLQYEVIVPTCDETTDKTKPEEIVMDLSRLKANSVASIIDKPSIIIAADTIVYLDGKILGKPKGKDEAFEMLSRLQGSWHTVYTGIAIIKNDGSIYNYYEKSDVHMRKVNDDEIWSYIKTGDPLDKAGAYGVQDSTCNFVDEVKGEIETVIGLPILRLKNELKIK